MTHHRIDWTGEAIGTTNPRLAGDLLEALSAANLRYAILHGEHALTNRAPLSDVDVVAEVETAELLRRLLPNLGTIDLHPVALWPYDAGGTASLFLATSDAGDGVQLDVLHDPRGLGRYGFRSGELLRSVEPGERWPRISDLDRVVYLLRKRQVKQQRERFEALRHEAALFSEPDLAHAIGRLMVPGAASALSNALGHRSGHRRSLSLGRYRSRVGRLAARLRSPVGHWAEVPAARAGEARETVRRFGRFLPRVGCGARPASPAHDARWFLTEVAPVRWRPGLYVSWADQRQHGGPGADSHLDVEVPLAPWVVARMEEHVLQGLPPRPAA